MSIKNGDLPAMPCHDVDFTRDEQGFFTIPLRGLTKREQFAMAAMQGILSNQGANLVSDEISTSAAELAVQVADALLAELEKSK